MKTELFIIILILLSCPRVAADIGSYVGKIISFYDRSDARVFPNLQDRWDHLFENVGNVATGVCRQKMPVGNRFGNI